VPEGGGETAELLGAVEGVLRQGVTDSLVTNPALRAINCAVSDFEKDLAATLVTINNTIAGYQQAALADYGKLTAMHKLLVVANSSWADLAIKAFATASLTPVEIELWKPLLKAGFGIQTEEVSGDFPTNANCYIPNSDYADGTFALWNGRATRFRYDGLTYYESRQPGYRGGYWARCYAIANREGDELASEALQQLFGPLDVPKQDVFNGYNGWNLPTGEVDLNFKWNLYVNRPDGSPT
jgi:hypothetical protein